MSNLNELVARYGKTNTEMKLLKKSADEDNKEIKNIMSSTGLSEYEAGGYKAKYSVTKSENFDEEKLVKKLKDYNFGGKSAHEAGLIDYVPVVNMEKLEDFIYDGKINAAQLADCKVVKETPRLTIVKIKE